MAIYVGKIENQWVHTYSKKLRDEYLGRDYVVIYTLGTGKSGGIKVRNSISISLWIKKFKKGEFPEEDPIPLLESGKRLSQWERSYQLVNYS